MAKQNKKDSRLQVNVDFNNAPELHTALIGLAKDETEGNVSLLVRKLCREGIARRQQLEMALNASPATNKSKRQSPVAA